MKINFKLFYLIVIFNASNATIINMEELYNEELNQTIILLSDMHVLNSTDLPQHDDLLAAVKKKVVT